MGCLIRYPSHLGPERGTLVGISTWHPECRVMHLNVGGGQLGYLSQYQVFLGSERCNELVLGMAKCLPLSGVLPG